MPGYSTIPPTAEGIFASRGTVLRLAKRLVWDNEDVLAARNYATLARWNVQLFTTWSREREREFWAGERERTCSDKKINSVYRRFIGRGNGSVKDSSREIIPFRWVGNFVTALTSVGWKGAPVGFVVDVKKLFIVCNVFLLFKTLPWENAMIRGKILVLDGGIRATW